MNPVMAVDGSSASVSRSSGGATADSYIGSLISLTSKSEIRYEGVLYNINTDESSIGLRNVRSYGTEGRKKDGPQVHPSDKIYEYILFRGSDIKDLQVKSSPPIQTPINNDPAIIQSHYSHQTTSSTALPSGGSGSMPDFGPNPAQLGHPGLTFQGGLPLYQPGENLNSWGPSPSLNANGSNHAMPMYWQGLYGTSNGLPPMQQQSLFRPPPGLSVPQSMQQIPYSGFNASMPTGAPNLLGSNLSEYPFPLVPAFNKPLDISSSLAAPTPPLTISPMQLSSAIDTSSLAESKATVSSSPAVSSATLPSLSPLENSGTNLNAALPSRSSHSNDVSGQFLQHLSNMQPVATVAATRTSTLVEAPTANLVTPGQLLQAGQSSASPYKSSQIAQKDVEVVQVAKPSSESRVPLPKSVQPPLLPLPQATQSHKPNEAPFQMRHNNYRGRGGRGRGRGRGYEVPRQAPRFTEDFDFEGMNEKFKKDEVWGHLGMSNKKENEGNGDDSVEENAHEYDGDLPNIEIKPVYSKDDFFDSLSSSTVDNDQRHGRTRFSEQVKIDTETFGDFARHRGGRGGRGPYRGGGGGRSRGSSYGRGNGYGYGYGGRGRGRGMSQGY